MGGREGEGGDCEGEGCGREEKGGKGGGGGEGFHFLKSGWVDGWIGGWVMVFCFFLFFERIEVRRWGN